MTSRLAMTKRDPRNTDFVLAPDHQGGHVGNVAVLTYTSDTVRYVRPRNGVSATTTVTRRDFAGDRLQVGVIDWPVRPRDREQLVVGTRDVRMTKQGIFTASERFMAADGCTYEWQIRDGRPQLVPFKDSGSNSTSAAYIATFVQSQSGFWLLRKHTASIFVPPEGLPILDDIIVTFIYFEGKWRDKEATRSRARLGSGLV